MERFIVGTGRCGSTLLSTMLSCHPEALIMSECLSGLDRHDQFRPGIVSKDEFRKILSKSNPLVDMSIKRNKVDGEALYDINNNPYPSLPVWLVACLPFITDQPDKLFQEILDEVNNFPNQSMAEHYRQTFAWLQKKFGKSLWIERSGESTVYLPKLFANFPRAKYVHIHRHGPEVVMSMAKHSYLSLSTSFFSKPATREELLKTEYGGEEVSSADPISQRLNNKPTLENYAAYWNFQLFMAYQAFARMEPSQLLQVRFDELIADPLNVLQKIAIFFELPDAPGWIDKAASLINVSQISNSLQEMSAAEQEKLEQYCMPGQVLLERAEHPWLLPLFKTIKELEEEGRLSENN